MKTVKTSFLISAVLLLASLILPYHAFAADDWEANLTVSVLTAENMLSFGQRPDATDGFDGKYDVPAMLGGNIKAYFVINSGSYWRDIKASAGDGVKVWVLRIDSPLHEKVLLQWSPESLPKGKKAVLVDGRNDTRVDMAQVSEYSYSNEGPRDVRIELRAE